MQSGIRKPADYTKDQILSHPRLLDLLELNGEQLTFYFEDRLIENPFIEFDYPMERRVSDMTRTVNQVVSVHSGSDQTGPSVAQDLETFIYEQIMLYRQTPIRDIMMDLVDELDERGYLPQSYQDLALKFQKDPIMVLDAITLLQQLEPAGLAAYDLQQCLMLQTEQDSHAPEASYQLLADYFEELEREDYQAIAQQSGLSDPTIQACVAYYQTLRPEPASLFDRPHQDQLIPDVQVVQERDGLQVYYNRQYHPQVRFNQAYYDEMAARQDADLMAYIQMHQKMYEDVSECLKIREALMLAVARMIVDQQIEFFKGEQAHPQPLLLKEIANSLNLPVSITRLVVMNKHLKIGNVVYNFNDFINVSGKIGRSGLSALNIQANIQAILSQAKGPLTDEDIVDKLSQQQIMISPQLVGRYRQNQSKQDDMKQD